MSHRARPAQSAGPVSDPAAVPASLGLPDAPRARPSRRTLLGAAAWSAPVITLVTAAPAFAASGTHTIQRATPAEGSFGVWDLATTRPLVALVSAGATPVAGESVTFTITPTETDWVSFGGTGTLTVTTDANGLASVPLQYVDTHPAAGAKAVIVATSQDGGTAAWTVTNRPVAPRTLAGGGASTVVVRNDGAILSWGNNQQGQLGNGTTTPGTSIGSSVPVTVTATGALAGVTVVAVASGATNVAALGSNGKVYTWGINTIGQLGDGTVADSNVPVAVTTAGVLAGVTVTAVAVGGSHSVALGSDGKVYTWGFGTNGQLGNGTTATSKVPVAVKMDGVLSGVTVVAVAAGYAHTVALGSNGKVYTWGQNASGQLGNGTTTSSNVPVEVPTTGALTGVTVTAVAAGGSGPSTGLTTVLGSNGKVYSWGINANSQLGNNVTTNSPVPVATSTFGALVGVFIASIATSTNGSHAVGLSSDGKIYAWGLNGGGQLGNGGGFPTKIPVATKMDGVLAGVTITALAAGGTHTAALGSDDRVYTWGANSSGQLGDGTADSRSSPVRVSTAAALSDVSVAAVAAGANHTATVGRNGKVYTWGSSGSGQLGDGAPEGGSSSVPVAVRATGVLAGVTVTTVSAGTSHTVALGSNGKVYAWGDNTQGQLGRPDVAYTSTPQAVDDTGALAGVTVVAVAAGSRHSVALGSDGTVYTWGVNSDGQLGDGATAKSQVPVAVTSGALAGVRVTAITAGGADGNHTLALGEDGVVYAWGLGTDGQLGNGTTTSSNVPVAVTTTGVLSGVAVTTISAGRAHSVALGANGIVHTWGVNVYGQLGTFDKVSSSVPQAVSTNSRLRDVNVSAVAAGGDHTVVLGGGRVYGWGLRESGQVGDDGAYDLDHVDTTAYPVVVVTTGALSGVNVTAIAAGASHTVALGDDGIVYTWGLNDRGQLGDASNSSRRVPVATFTG